jgi:PAS domain S-box-containing protein
LFEVSSDIMAVLEPSGHWHASPAGTRILGYPIGWDPEGGILSLVHPEDFERAGQALDEVLSGTRAKHEPIRVRLRHLDGHYLWFDCTAENQIDNPTVRGLIIIARDVTDQKTAEDAQLEAEQRFRATFERSPLGIALITIEGNIIDANAAFSIPTTASG